MNISRRTACVGLSALCFAIPGCVGTLAGEQPQAPPQSPHDPTADGGFAWTDSGPSPGWDAGPPPSPGDPTYDLGTPPPGLSVAWPAAPMITREASASTLAEVRAAMRSGTRIRVSGTIAGVIEVTVSDIELDFEPGASAHGVWIANRIARIVVRGGSFGVIEMQVSGQYYPTEEFHPEWRTTDVLIDRVDVNAADTAFLMRGGVRIAITHSRARAVRYGIWFGDTAFFESEDVIVAGNDIACQGPEATVRLVHVRRSATIGNRLANGEKHNYRVHGRSELNWGARNTLIDTGAFLGRLPDDDIGQQWFEDNTFYHRAPSLLELDFDIPLLSLRGNTVYSDVWNCLYCSGTPPAGWIIESNRMMPYTAPPSR